MVGTGAECSRPVFDDGLDDSPIRALAPEAACGRWTTSARAGVVDIDRAARSAEEVQGGDHSGDHRHHAEQHEGRQEAGAERGRRLHLHGLGPCLHLRALPGS